MTNDINKPLAPSGTVESYEEFAEQLVAKYGFANWQCEEAFGAGTLAGRDVRAVTKELRSALDRFERDLDDVVRNGAAQASVIDIREDFKFIHNVLLAAHSPVKQKNE